VVQDLTYLDLLHEVDGTVANIVLVFLMRPLVILLIAFYGVSSVAVTAQRAVTAAGAFDLSRAQAGLRTPGTSNIDGSLPKFREAKKVIPDAVSELLPTNTVIEGSGREDIVPAAFHLESADVTLLPARSPPPSA
jgi:hypothetical protein